MTVFENNSEELQAARVQKISAHSRAMSEGLSAAVNKLWNSTAKATLSRWNVDGAISEVISCFDPYPEYSSLAQNSQAANAIVIDRQMVAQLAIEKRIDLEPMLQWISQACNRREIKNNMQQGDEANLVMALQRANYAAPHEAETIIAEQCTPILRRLMPEAFINPHNNLKKVIAKRMFFGGGENTVEPEEMALCSQTSSAIMGTITRKLIKGHKAILCVPFFDPFIDYLLREQVEVVLSDTTKTDFKMRAQDLEDLIAKNNMGKGDWLVLTSPNNATMSPYSREELQAIADVVAKSGIRVLCDELYAGFGKEPPVSLASLESWQPDGLVKMRDRVITVTGCSKQFPFGSDSKRKLGAGIFANPEEAASIQRLIDQSNLGVQAENADIYAGLITSTPGNVRVHMRKRIEENTAVMQQAIRAVNENTKMPAEEQPITMIQGDGSYFACISLSQRLADKVGIHSGDDLMQYLLATTGLVAASMSSEGVPTPMVRINIIEASRHSAVLQSRLEKLVTKIENGTAPRMDEINKSFNQLIAQAGTMQQPRKL